MADIFLSYSKHDRPQALALFERLGDAGISVWMDQTGIVGAEKWASEIVEGIRGCSTFMLLISPDAVESENVLKELSLATEKRKRILPVILALTELPASFEYLLAGLQHVPISDFAKILEGHRTGLARREVVKDHKKSLMVLPFEDLSPSGEDNMWFADGLTSELISALSHIKSLRVSDRQTAMSFKGFRGKTVEIAKELDIRYFLQGSVRKFSDQIKISVELLDIQKGDHLWNDSYKGAFADIFDFEEEVAKKVVEGLKLKLPKDEKEILEERDTRNAEAYEYYLKAEEYFERQTKEGWQHTLSLLTQAIELDPKFAEAYQLKARVLAELYRIYDRNPAHLTEAETLALKAQELKPKLWAIYGSLSSIYLRQNHLQESEAAALEYVRRAPEDGRSHFALGYYYMESHQPEKAIAPYEESLRLDPDRRGAYLNLANVLFRSGKRTEGRLWSEKSLPTFEAWLKLHPDDHQARAHLANLLFESGRREEALRALAPLENRKDLDGFALYNIACVYSNLEDYAKAIEMLNRSVEAGHANIEHFRMDPDLDPLRGMAEFQELMKKLEEKSTNS